MYLHDVAKPRRRILPSRALAIVTIAALMSTTACDREQELASEPGPRNASVSPAAGKAHARPDESPFADLGARLKSTAGFYYDSVGRMVVLVRDAADDRAAQAVVAELVGLGKIKYGAGRGWVPPQIVVRRAQFSFEELSAWRDLVFDFANSSTNNDIVSLDLDEVANRVAVGVSRQAALTDDQLKAQLVQLGISPAALDFKRRDPVRRLSSNTLATNSTARAMMSQVLDVRDNAPRLIGGLAIRTMWPNGSAGECTLGFAVTHNGQQGFLTASHCTQQEFGTDGTTAGQNATSSTVIAQETNDPFGYNCGLRVCRPSDASFFQLTNFSRPLDIGLVARFPTPLADTHKYFDDNMWVVTDVESNNLYVGTPVLYMGEKSGQQGGSIINTCVDHWTGGFARVVTCEYEANAWVDQTGGDSGAPVLVQLGGDRGNEVIAAGILTGLDSDVQYQMVFSKMSRVISDFAGTGASLSIVRPATLPAPSVSGSVDGGGHPQLNWTPVSGATNYNIYRKRYDVGCSPVTSWDEYIGSTTSTVYGDPGVAATRVTTFPDCPYAQYYIFAVTPHDITAHSTLIFFETP